VTLAKESAAAEVNRTGYVEGYGAHHEGTDHR
jgi:hypothetical protein